MSPKRMPKWLAIACTLGFFLGLDADGLAAQQRPRIAKVQPTYAYLVPDIGQLSDGDSSFLKNALSKVKRRRGVKRAEIIADKEILLEIDPKTFKPENAIQDLEGLRVEMRLPYKWIELRVVEGASFPPRSEIDDEGALIVEFSPQLKDAIGQALGFSMPPRMKCIGKLDSPKANDATLMRFETEKLSPGRMIPFMAMADFDGDKDIDLFLRLKGLPEMIIFNQGDTFRVLPLSPPTSELTSIPRCDQDPRQYVRVVPNKKIQCLSPEKKPKDLKGDAFEVIRHNVSNKLLMWDGSKVTSCEPFGEGALPPVGGD